MSEKPKITIAIADDEALFRKGMKLILNEYEDCQIVMEAANGEELLDQLSSTESLPDILLLDLKMPKMDGIAAAREIRQKYPSLKFIVLSTHFSRAFILNMIELGAASYLPKNSEPDEVAKTIRGVYAKGFHYNDEVMTVIRENLINKSKPKPHFPFQLTAREKEVLQLICQQYTTREIGTKLFISPRTVDGHRNNLLTKMNCKNIAGLVAFAIQNQLVEISLKPLW
jgi:Response regulator containing a CheY-like receiver domain and an HTH DNA-binding domain